MRYSSHQCSGELNFPGIRWLLITSGDKLTFYDFFAISNIHQSSSITLHLSSSLFYLCSSVFYLCSLVLHLCSFVFLVFTCVPLVFTCVPLVFTCVLLVFHLCSTCVHLCSFVFHLCSFVFICVPLVFICVPLVWCFRLDPRPKETISTCCHHSVVKIFLTLVITAFPPVPPRTIKITVSRWSELQTKAIIHNCQFRTPKPVR